MRLAASAASGWISSAKAQPELPQETRLAVQWAGGRYLLLGGSLKPLPSGDVYQPRMKSLPKEQHLAPSAPGYLLYYGRPEDFDLVVENRVLWRRGDVWKLFGSTAPARDAVIQATGMLLYCGGIGGYEVAAADPLAQDDAAAGPPALIVMPGSEAAEVVCTPLEPVSDSAVIETVARLLLALGRKDFELLDPPPPSDRSINGRWLRRLAEMNRRLHSGAPLRRLLRLLRWAPAGREPLLLAEGLWKDSNGMALLGSEAVIAPDRGWRLIHYEPRTGGYMRMLEFRGETWDGLQDPPVFLGAWLIAGEPCLLMQRRGYEGFRLDLMRISADRLEPARLSYSAGC